MRVSFGDEDIRGEKKERRRKITAIRGVDAVSSIAPLAWQQDVSSSNCAERGFDNRG